MINKLFILWIGILLFVSSFYSLKDKYLPILLIILIFLYDSTQNILLTLIIISIITRSYNYLILENDVKIKAN